MDDWAIPFMAGWCLTGVSRLPAWVIWKLTHPVPTPPEPPHPNWGPLPEPWLPLVYGLIGGLGGVAAWATVGARFAHDGLASAVIVGVLGGGVAMTLVDAVAGLRTRTRA
jgi:hypothetical protein